MNLIAFLFQAFVISLSGVMAPGPVTAITLGCGTKSRHAGAWIAVGHGLIELPLMLLIVAGMNAFFKQQAVQIVIGLVGGVVLVVMGWQLVRASAVNKDESKTRYAGKNPMWIGVLFSAGNPYFLFWWATVGLALANRAAGFGKPAFVLFAVIHWLCDLIWLEALSLTGFKGSKMMSPKSQSIVLRVCAVALLLFGALFVYDAGKRWIRLEHQQEQPIQTTEPG